MCSSSNWLKRWVLYRDSNKVAAILLYNSRVEWLAGRRTLAHRTIAHRTFAHRTLAHRTLAHRTLAHLC